MDEENTNHLSHYAGSAESYGEDQEEYEYTDQAIPLVSFNPANNSYELQDNAIRFIQSLEPPIAVVAVAGLYRTGKSYLLNRVLLNRNEGFGVGPTVNPCTKGLWIWGRPISGTTAEGEHCNIIIIDSEGIGALDEDQDHDSRIFSLAILLSSYFVYNSIGSIDESSLQNLSLIVNLTKHIHIKSQQREDGEPDCDDYAIYFPSFMWVIRDFTLQLVDEDGEQITSKEYLEKALTLQKGFSDAIEEKNRIRKLLKNFFAERDCATLVRPTTSESDLQNLAEKPLDQLRPEFVAQVLDLRHNILNRVKPKTLNGNRLRGEMLADLIESYVSAINGGAVPCIENAWSYICKNECIKALEDAEVQYENNILSLIGDKFPMDPEELRNIHQEAREQCIKYFRQRAVGGNFKEFLIELKQKIKEKYECLKADNVAESKEFFSKFLEDNYKVIQSKLNSGNCKSILDYHHELNKFQMFFQEHGPKGPARNEALLDFCLSSSLDAADYFISSLSNELQLQQEMQQEKIQSIETEMGEIKDEFRKEQQSMEDRLKMTETIKEELAIRESQLLDNCQRLRKERDDMENELKEILRNTKVDFSEKLETANNNINEYQEKIKEMERLLYQNEADKEQTKVLLEQKVKFLENSLNEKISKERDHINAINIQKKDYSSMLKETQNKFESQIHDLQIRLETEKEKVSDLERAVSDKETDLENVQHELKHLTEHYQSMLQDNQGEIDGLRNTLKQRDEKFKKDVQKQLRDNEDAVSKLRKRVSELERQLRLSEDQLSQVNSSYENEKAIWQQKLEFAEQELCQYKSQLDEERTQHQNMLQTMQNVNEDQIRQEFQVSINQLKDYHEAELKKLEAEYEGIKKDLQAENERLSKENGDLQLGLKVAANDKEASLSEIQDQLNSLTLEKEDLQRQLDEYRFQVEEHSGKTTDALKSEIARLESQIESLNQENIRELSQLNNKNEESLQQLRQFYEQEKVRLEQRIAEEKERAEKRYNSMCEEYEQRINEEQEQYEDEIMGLQEEIRELEYSTTEEIQEYKNQASLDQQKIDSLENYISEIKENLANLQKTSSSTIDQQIENFNRERNQLIEKIDNLNAKLSNKEQEITSISYNKQQLEYQLNQREKELQEITEEYNKDKQSFSTRLEQAKIANQKLADEINQRKSDFKREVALANQQIEFQSKKIEDLEQTIAESNSRQNEALQALKEETGLELNEAVNKLNQAKEALEIKLEQKKQALREIQIQSSKEINILEKDKTVLSEKLASLDNKHQETIKKYTIEIEELQSQLSEYNDTKQVDTERMQNELEELQSKVQTLEKQLNEKASILEREQTLWKNKNQFLTQQRDQLKSDLQEAQKKFDATLENFQKRGNMDKDKLEATTQQLIQSIESRYTSQIADLQSSHQASLQEYTEKNKTTETELRALRETLEFERRAKTTECQTLEKRIQELVENDNKRTKEIEYLKSARDNSSTEFNEQLLKEKEQSRQKIADLEKRCKEAEQQRGQLYLEHEKDRVTWALERDHLTTQKNEAVDMLERLEKRKEALLRENEKLRSERATRPRISGVIPKRGENLNPLKSAIGNMISNSNISFEEFAREKINNSSGTNTPCSSVAGEGEASPRPLRLKNFSMVRGKSPALRENRRAASKVRGESGTRTSMTSTGGKESGDQSVE